VALVVSSRGGGVTGSIKEKKEKNLRRATIIEKRRYDLHRW